MLQVGGWSQVQLEECQGPSCPCRALMGHFWLWFCLDSVWFNRDRLQRCARPHGQLWLLHAPLHLRRHTWRLQPGQLHFGPGGHQHEGVYLSFKTRTLVSHRVSSRLSFWSQIPLLQRAQAMSPQPLHLLASAWSAPAWMKTNGALIGKGSLKGQPGGKEHKAWAQYYVRWFMKRFYLKAISDAAKINALNAPLNPLSGFWRNMLNITSPSGHWLQEMSPLLDEWQTTGLIYTTNNIKAVFSFEMLK